VQRYLATYLLTVGAPTVIVIFVVVQLSTHAATATGLSPPDRTGQIGYELLIATAVVVAAAAIGGAAARRTECRR
jgi:hypothetical protein